MKTTCTRTGGSQSFGLSPRDFGRARQRGNDLGYYFGGQDRDQNRSTWMGLSESFGRKRDRDTYSQGSVA